MDIYERKKRGLFVKMPEWVDYRLVFDQLDALPVEIEGHFIPRNFEIEFLFKDQKPKSALLWRSRLVIGFDSGDIPRAFEVRVMGFSHQTKRRTKKDQQFANIDYEIGKLFIVPLSEPQPVQRWQLEVVENKIVALIASAVSIFAQSFTFDPESARKRNELRLGVEKGDIDPKSFTEPDFLNWNNVEDFFGAWIHNSNVKNSPFDSGLSWEIDANEIDSIRQNIESKSRRRKVTDVFLKEVARVYLEEIERAKSTNEIHQRRPRPVEAVVFEFDAGSNRTADYWIEECRKRGYLPPIENKKVSSPKKSAGNSRKPNRKDKK